LHLAYKSAGEASKISKMKKFLINNDIIKNNDVSKETLEKLYKEYFNKIDKHGNKIKNGKLAKYGSKENVYKSYIVGGIKKACNYYNIDYEEVKLYDEETISEIMKKYRSDIKFKNHNPIEWKKKHLINLGINIDNINDKKIEILYSEHMSERFKHQYLTNKNSGYKKSKKGWFKFTNTNKDYFYRSSWELNILKIIDDMIIKKEIIKVFEPDRIKYFFDDRSRYYYPDIGYELNDGRKIILEIKPYRKTFEPINLEKIKVARSVLDNFVVLTENEIFSDNITKILLNGVT